MNKTTEPYQRSKKSAPIMPVPGDIEIYLSIIDLHSTLNALHRKNGPEGGAEWVATKKIKLKPINRRSFISAYSKYQASIMAL
jgi:hypothetical protein